MPSKYITITFKIGLLVSISIILSTFVLAAVYVITSRQEATSDIQKSSLNFAEVTSQPIYQDYLVSTSSRFKTLLFNRMSKNKDIFNISMIGFDGRIYFESDTLRIQPPTQTSDFIDIASTPKDVKFIEDPTTLNMVKSQTTVRRTIIQNDQLFEEIIVPVKETETTHTVSIRYLVSYQSLEEKISEIYLQSAIIIPLCLVFIIISILVSRTITKPLNQLFLAFKQVRDGNYNVTLDNKKNDEIGQLSETFNKMVQSFKENQQRQQEYQHTLETEVNTRTEELGQKVNELESLNKLMIDRELKMVELKKEISDLIEKCSPFIKGLKI